MPPTKYAKERKEGPDGGFSLSQSSNEFDTLELKLKLAKKYCAEALKKKAKADKLIPTNAVEDIWADFSQTGLEVQQALKTIQETWSEITKEYAANEERIYHVTNEILRREERIRKKISELKHTVFDQQRVLSVGRLRKPCEISERVINKNEEGDDDNMNGIE